MWNAVVEIVTTAMHGGAAGVLVIIIIAWMVDRYFLVRDLKELNRQMLHAFTDSTAATTRLSTLIDQLCQRI